MTNSKQEPNYIKYGRILANRANAKESVIACFIVIFTMFTLGISLAMLWAKTGGVVAVIGLAVIPHAITKMKAYKKAQREYEEFHEATRQPWDKKATQ